MYKNKEKCLAVRIDRNNKIMIMYDIKNGLIREETKGILDKVNKDIGAEISEHYDVALSDYGVEILEDDESFSVN